MFPFPVDQATIGLADIPPSPSPLETVLAEVGAAEILAAVSRRHTTTREGGDE
jgi:hypothetical protein